MKIITSEKYSTDSNPKRFDLIDITIQSSNYLDKTTKTIKINRSFKQVYFYPLIVLAMLFGSQLQEFIVFITNL